MNGFCQFKRGFFTLRACERPAANQCESCGKSSCQFHLSAQNEMRLCIECARAQNRSAEADYQDDDWVYSYRSWYYASGYQPYRYESQDYASFDNYGDATEDWDDNYAGDFSDS